jgi:hypothetical protein
MTVTVKMMLKNEMKKVTGLQAKMAKLAGYDPSSGGFSKFLTKPKADIKSLDGLLAVINELFPGKEREIMSQYIYELAPGHTARMCLEYTQLNKMYDEFEYLMEILAANKKNPEDQEWAKIYGLDYEAIKGSKSPKEALILMDGLKTNTEEMYAYAQISRYYSMYDLGFFESMNKLTPFVTELVDGLEEGYIKSSYEYRIALISMEVDLHKGNIDKVKEFANKIPDCKHPNIQCMLYLQLGNAYTFESYEKSIKYLKLGNNIAKLNNNQTGIKQTQASINFVNTYHGKGDLELKPESKNVSHKHEIAFDLIQKGQSQQALEILENMDVDTMSDMSKGFHFYYRGMATNDERHFFKSLKFFSSAGEVFYKTTSLLELKKIGTKDYILEAFAV